MNIKLSARRLNAALVAMLLIGGLCGHASAAATSVSSCQTLSAPGNYVLTQNLTATGDCLVIGADNVAIDLSGKTISGNGSGSGITDGGIDRHVAIIANGAIQNFAVGINLTTSGNAIISNVTSSKNTGDGIFIDRCCNLLDAVTANNNGGSGIDITSDDSSLSNIQANNNGSGGIFIPRCCNALVGSTASNNTGIGVEMRDNVSFVISSKIQNNSDTGLDLEDCCNGVIKSNTSNNGGDGIEFSHEGDNMVTASKSNGNSGAGIDDPEKWGIVSGVQANNNSADGVDMLCRGSTASLSAKGNSGTNLVQTVTDGPCANVNLKAP